jgi:dolichol-phosphate mannosyltransferase
MSPRPLVSLVVPTFNEEANLPKFHAAMSEIARDYPDLDWEMLFVDDGSRDRSFLVLSELRQRDPRVRALRFSRNFGSHVAIAAGLDHCAGDATVIMAADLQDPPAVVREFLAKWRDGFDVVWGTRTGRDERGLRPLLTRVFYRLVRRYAIPSYPKTGTGSFCLISRRVVETFRQCKERNRLTFGLIAWSGFRETQVPYHRPEREAGQSAWTASKLLKSAIDTFIAFSFAPIRVISYLGLIVSLISFGLGFYVLMSKLLHGTVVEGWTSVMLAVLTLSGVQLLMIGVLGEYLGRILEEARNRPLYVLDRTLGYVSEPAASREESGVTSAP